jgi:hypothetical protein
VVRVHKETWHREFSNKKAELKLKGYKGSLSAEERKALKL